MSMHDWKCPKHSPVEVIDLCGSDDEVITTASPPIKYNPNVEPTKQEGGANSSSSSMTIIDLSTPPRPKSSSQRNSRYNEKNNISPSRALSVPISSHLDSSGLRRPRKSGGPPIVRRGGQIPAYKMGHVRPIADNSHLPSDLDGGLFSNDSDPSLDGSGSQHNDTTAHPEQRSPEHTYQDHGESKPRGFVPTVHLDAIPPWSKAKATSAPQKSLLTQRQSSSGSLATQSLAGKPGTPAGSAGSSQSNSADSSNLEPRLRPAIEVIDLTAEQDGESKLPSIGSNSRKGKGKETQVSIAPPRMIIHPSLIHRETGTRPSSQPPITTLSQPARVFKILSFPEAIHQDTGDKMEIEDVLHRAPPITKHPLTTPIPTDNKVKPPIEWEVVLEEEHVLHEPPPPLFILEQALFRRRREQGQALAVIDRHLRYESIKVAVVKTEEVEHGMEHVPRQRLKVRANCLAGFPKRKEELTWSFVRR